MYLPLFVCVAGEGREGTGVFGTVLLFKGGEMMLETLADRIEPVNKKGLLSREDTVSESD